ncbi:diguanylate cyclase domain-containing protein [Aquirhabdus sp.]|uniref:diguanylate cyclase domain-containing protein n=1 Tax=Aquirhabdus sp. TaxID=2824160 RepID=UPI00396CC619
MKRTFFSTIIGSQTQPTLKHIFKRTHFVVLLIALLICGFSLSVLSLFALDNYAKKNLQLIASTVSYRVEAGVVFNDRPAIQETIDQLAYRDDFSTIRIEDIHGQVLAELKNTKKGSFDALDQLFNHFMFLNPTSEAIKHDDETVGTVWVSGNSKVITKFLSQVLLGLVLCLVITLISVSYFSYRTHGYIVQSFEKMTTVANLVREQRAFNLRLPKAKIQELDELSQDFNSLLDEIELWHQNLKQENDTLTYKAQHDSLTGLPNRGYFETRLESLFHQAKDSSQLALLFFDNDRFKEINDTYGHAAGDFVLTQTSVRLQSRLRQKDFLARLGGDEFAAILPQIVDEKNAIMVAEAILATLNDPIYLPNGQRLFIHLSIGIALSQDCKTPEQLLEKADAAMYHAKRSPSNSWYLSD